MNESIKTVYLHIGYHKTATSSIQQTLFNNRQLLNEYGFFYPNTWPRNHGMNLTSIFYDKPERYDLNIIRNKNKQESLKFNNKQIRILEDEINNTSSEKVIISGEDISVMDEESVKKLLSFFRKITPNAEIKIVVCTREYVSFVTSAIQQFEKAGHSFESMISGIAENVVHRSRIEKFINNVGIENIIIYRFEDALQYKKGPVECFLNKIGIDNDLINKMDIVKLNESLSNKSIDLLMYINKRSTLVENYKINRGRKNGDTKILNSISGDKFSLSLNRQKEILKNSEEDVQWLKLRTGVDYTNYEVKFKKVSKIIFDEVYENELKSISSKLSPTILKLTYDYFNDKLKDETNDISRLTFENLLKFYDNIYGSSLKNSTLETFISKIEYEKEKIEINKQNINQCITKINNNKFVEADYYRELALFCEVHDKIETAKYFMDIAKELRPYGKCINSKCKEYEKKIKDGEKIYNNLTIAQIESVLNRELKKIPDYMGVNEIISSIVDKKEKEYLKFIKENNFFEILKKVLGKNKV